MSTTQNTVLQQTAIGRLFHKWVFALNGIGTLWIFAIMIIMNTDIFMRFVFGAPIDGVTEIIELSIAGIVFLQLADAVRAGRLTRSDGLYNRLAEANPKLGHILGFFFDLCGAIFFVCILLGGLPMFIDAWVGNEYAGIDGVFTVIVWPIRLILVISCISVIGVFISFMLDHVIALKSLKSGNGPTNSTPASTPTNTPTSTPEGGVV